MKQSQLFTKIERSAPKDEVALNAQLLKRAGFIYKNSAGVYSFLPLGLRVIRKISDIVREEMNAVGAQEVAMPALVSREYWEKTGRWDVDVALRTATDSHQLDAWKKFWKNNKEDLSDNETRIREELSKLSQYALGWTHEEVITEISKKYLSSHKQLPFVAYQIQTKFRNEARAKSGLLRGREFLMKDAYSFHQDEKDLHRYYDIVRDAYFKIYEQCGLKAIYTLAAGGEFTSNFTHEFQVILPVGEDTIYVCENCGYSENKEISKLKDGEKCEKCGGIVKEEKAVEVGNIFPLGTKFSKAFDLKYKEENGDEQLVVMGCYGIGVSRLMGVIVEKFNDENGIIWPESVAPFRVHLLALGGADGLKVYEHLQHAGVEVLYDDRDISAGQKFAEADLVGIPWRIVVSAKLGDGMIEVKKRDESEAKIVGLEEALKLIKHLNS